MKYAPTQSKTPSIESTMLNVNENNYACWLIPAQQVLFECPVASVITPRTYEHTLWTNFIMCSTNSMLSWPSGSTTSGRKQDLEIVFFGLWLLVIRYNGAARWGVGED